MSPDRTASEECPYCRPLHDGSISGTLLSLQVQPRSSRPGPLAFIGERVKWGVCSAPVDGKANAELEESVAKFFDIPKRCVAVVQGHRSRKKVVALNGLEKEQTAKLLKNALASVVRNSSGRR